MEIEDRPSDFAYFWQMLELAARRKYYIVGMTLLGVAGALCLTRLTKPVYTASTSVLIEKSDPSSGGVADSVTVDVRSADYYQTQYTVLRSYGLAKAVFEDLDLSKTPLFQSEPNSDPVEDLRKRVKVKPDTGTRIVEIAVTLPDPKMAAACANSWARQYIKASFGNKVFLSEAVKRLMANEATAADLEALPEVVTNPLIQALKIQENKLDQEIIELSGRYRPEHQQMLILKKKLNNTHAGIQRELENIAASVRARAAARASTNYIRVIDEAVVPNAPSAPKPQRNLLVGLMLGILLGCLAALLRDQSDTSIRTSAELERFTGIASLGNLPLMEPRESSAALFVASWTGQDTVKTRAFRELRASIAADFAFARPLNAFLLTSSLASEGKSWAALNLAAAFERSGEKVLLIDSDLQNSSLRPMFKMPEERGLSLFMTSQDAPEQHILDIGLANLRFMPSGPAVPSSSTELLSRPRLGQLMEWARGNFNRIIVDLPPLVPTSDTLPWLRYVPEVIFLVAAQETRREYVQHSLKKLQAASANVVGTVFNKARDLPRPYYAIRYSK